MLARKLCKVAVPLRRCGRPKRTVDSVVGRDGVRDEAGRHADEVRDRLPAIRDDTNRRVLDRVEAVGKRVRLTDQTRPGLCTSPGWLSGRARYGGGPHAG